nr:MAG TPA: hypothetical protein [Caudoviricetes sp.]
MRFEFYHLRISRKKKCVHQDPGDISSSIPGESLADGCNRIRPFHRQNRS